MLLKFAIRNVLRNRKRSFLTALSIFFGALIGTLSFGLIGGMLETYTAGYINNQTGNLRIVTEEYIKRERFLPVDEIVIEADALRQKLLAMPEVSGVEERIQFGLILGKGENSVAALGIGTDLINTRLKIGEKLIEGTISDSGLYLGQELARKLGAKLGDEILLATQTSSGGLNGIKLTVKGIVAFQIGTMDKKVFMLGGEDARKLLKISQGTTALYVFTHMLDQTDQVAAAISPDLDPGVRAQTFREQMGTFYGYFAMAKYMFMIFVAAILFLASFVMINTMMMAIFERMHEIGTLKAMGMKDSELFLNFTLEGSLLGMAGGILGTLAGTVLVIVIARQGLDLSSAMSTVDFPIDFIVRPRIRLGNVLTTLVLSLVTPAVAAMLPARYARSLTPVDALRQ